MNILFLDDSEDRCKRFRSWCPSSIIVNTADDCIWQLKHNEYDIVFLDHDLGGKIYVNSRDKDCGMEVVRWLAKRNINLNTIIVHSLNSSAATLMTEKLRKANYNVSYVPFTILFNMIEDLGGLEDFVNYFRKDEI